MFFAKVHGYLCIIAVQVTIAVIHCAVVIALHRYGVLDMLSLISVIVMLVILSLNFS